MSRFSFNCFEEAGELQPNPDIGGTGVFVGFVGTAWSVVALVILYYFLALDPLKSPYWTPGNSEDDADDDFAPNPIDKFVIESIRWVGQFVGSRLRDGWASKRVYSWSRQQSSKRSRWGNAFRTTILGIFVMSKYSQASASFSVATLVCSAMLLRGYLNHHRGERNVRLFFMTVLWLALFPAIAPTAFFNWTAQEPTAADPASNARCYFEPGIGRALYDKSYATIKAFDEKPGDRHPGSFNDSAALESAILSSLLLFFSYFTRSIKLIPSLSRGFRNQVRGRASRRYVAFLGWIIADDEIRQEQPSPVRLLRREWLTVRPLMAVYLVGKLYADILSSDVSDVYWLVVSALWGTFQLREARLSVEVEDDDWGFGQILPVFLLLGPIVMTVQAVVALPSTTSKSPSPSSHGSILLQTLPPPSTAHSQDDSHTSTGVNNAISQSGTEGTVSDIKEIMETAYRDKKHMPPAILLAFAQVLYLTALFFSERLQWKERAFNFMMSSIMLILLYHPFSTCSVLLIGLIPGGPSSYLVFPFLAEKQDRPMAPNLIAAYGLGAFLFVFFTMMTYVLAQLSGLALLLVAFYYVPVCLRIFWLSRRAQI
ncbi:hypothetical protein B0T14DRAFT_565370 [Immersiella caudata]|uniref:Transmembrane protein n=1 Tax=Immersiella caudata TaxID=314043 RepID=A0AA39WYR7_9PEZI|nr:hypothetical protein B0T14DRAFT_565370 [Immersiella caudata]